MKDTVSKFNSDVLNLSRKMRDKASELRKVTKEKLNEVLELAEQFDEICEIVKRAYPAN